MKNAIITLLFMATIFSNFAFAVCHKLTVSFPIKGTEKSYDYETNVSMWYTPCGKQKEETWAFKSKPVTLDIEENSRIRIGPKWTSINWINEDVKGTKTEVKCPSFPPHSFFLQASNCEIVR